MISVRRAKIKQTPCVLARKTVFVKRACLVLAYGPEICYLLDMEYIMAFGSTHKALKAESVLKEGGVPFKLLPAPKALAAYCALVISVDEGALDRAISALAEAGAGPKSIYRKAGEEYDKV